MMDENRTVDIDRRACATLSDTIELVARYRPDVLPENIPVDKVKDLNVGELLALARKIVDDDDLWASLPQKPYPQCGWFDPMTKTRDSFRRIIKKAGF